MKDNHKEIALSIIEKFKTLTPASDITAKLSAKILVEHTLKAIEDIEDFDSDLFQSELSEHYFKWWEVSEEMNK